MTRSDGRDSQSRARARHPWSPPELIVLPARLTAAGINVKGVENIAVPAISYKVS